MGGAIFVLLLLYFVPAVVALLRSHKDAPAIAAINLLLGWTVAGWFVSFIWALSDPRGRGATTVVVNTVQQNAAPTAAPPPTTITADADTAFWDTVSSRADADGYEEYLVRFPEGRFAELARKRLVRAGSSEVVAPTGAA
jgi:hypothetical protein